MEHSYTELRTRIQSKIDDLSNWLSTDIILLDGELAIVRLSGENDVRAKSGNGKDHFSELPYLNQSQFEELCSSLSLEISSSTLLSGVTYQDEFAYQLGSQSDKLLAPISSLHDLKGYVNDLSETLSDYALLSDTVLTEFSDWTFDTQINGFLSYDDEYWVFHSQDGSTIRTTNTDKYATTVEFNAGKFPYIVPVIATRERYSGYKLGSQSDKLLQPAGNYLSTSVFEDQISSVKDSLSALSDYIDGISSEVSSLVGGSLSNYVPLSGDSLVSNDLSVGSNLYVNGEILSSIISAYAPKIIFRQYFEE